MDKASRRGDDGAMGVRWRRLHSALGELALATDSAATRVGEPARVIRRR
ncbi:hypothetical protein G6O69_07835 [Pseudenhygromyxa sp. WMMC2535]|nr:hypothetical protein [Pseudenhygromyxa sp. WMMC2535]NVB37740.1 hypothetical protein [Pseudenhygromyxa sp. WMMC2535]